MDTIENLIIAIVKPLISQPDNLIIKIIDTPEFMEYHLDLDVQDIGRVIGKKGRTITFSSVPISFSVSHQIYPSLNTVQLGKWHDHITSCLDLRLFFLVMNAAYVLAY